MTNKTKTILCVCALTASAFAWNATADGIRYQNNTFPEAAWLHTNNGVQNATFFQAVTTESTDSILSFDIERNNTENGFIFGTYTTTIGDDGKTIINRTTLGTVDGTLDENEKILIKPQGSQNYEGSVPSNTFKANDIVGIWMQETGKDFIYYSDNALTLKENGITDNDAIYTVGTLGGIGPDAYLWFDDDIIDINNPGEGYSGQDTTAFVKIHLQGIASASGGNTSGGPLPGVWATIALAGAASAYLKRRKKENK